MPRVISGKWRGLKLNSLGGDQTRPTSDRVKEALFSSLNFRIYGASFLDLYAGSGQVGLEAYSRGAEKVVLVEDNRQANRIIKQNLALIKTEVGAIVHLQKRVEQLTPELGLFDIVYADPPWTHFAEAWRTIEKIAPVLTKTGGLLIVESEEAILELPGFCLEKIKKYGRTKLNYHRRII
ncbi:MAG: 16S rRNA (guanine(966)-N(2))-methyltransferase RsmD [Eubacteriales bacterium]|nr:16S rRNA (guanine(966)-N(2))-methyltransferase RsmD [Eubacteriales bacterium]